MYCCKYCCRVFERPSGLAVHEPACPSNPDRVKRTRSPKAGRQKGSVAHNKGKRTSEEELLSRTVNLIESGKLREYCETAIRRHMKLFLIHTHGHRCQVCNTSEWNGQPVPLVCDHIDGDSTNSDLDNFRIVCCNCDAQLPTFKSKNRGKGRNYNREYRRGG